MLTIQRKYFINKLYDLQIVRYQKHFKFEKRCFNKIITMNKKNPVNLTENQTENQTEKH